MPLDLVRNPDKEKTVAEIFTANVRASEGAGTTTLTSSDSIHQIFTLTAARDCVLPTTNILKGQVIKIENKGAFDLTIKASGGLALTLANGANMDATINSGYVILEALQDVPTMPAHWYVQEVYDMIYPALPTPTGAITSPTANRSFKVQRHNKSVSVFVREASTSATASDNISYSAAVPLRFRPSTRNKYCATMLINNNSLVGGLVTIDTGGGLAFYKYDASNFSGTIAIGAASSESSFSYLID